MSCRRVRVIPVKKRCTCRAATRGREGRAQDELSLRTVRLNRERSSERSSLRSLRTALSEPDVPSTQIATANGRMRNRTAQSQSPAPGCVQRALAELTYPDSRVAQKTNGGKDERT